MALFQITHIKADYRVIIDFDPSFGINNWASLEFFYQKEIKEGFIFWDFDLGRLGYINSMMLGLLVGFNTMLASRGGKLRLLTPSDSRIADLIKLSRLDQIIEMVQYEQEGQPASPSNS